ncbi:transcriptional regulator [Pseudofrankia saprophytica]|uniref:transcriptional regulator n=1 Tax=Pseudofrankia saprophytica TaxID=298655 RepID=UPI0031593D67
MVAELAAAEISAAMGYPITPADFGWRGEQRTRHDLELSIAGSPQETLGILAGLSGRDVHRGGLLPEIPAFTATAFAQPALSSLTGIVARVEQASPSSPDRGQDPLDRGQDRARDSGDPTTSAAMIREVTASFRKLDARLGSREIRSHAVTFLHDRLRAVKNGPTSADLCGAFGDLAQFSGWLSQECEHQALAQRYYIQALGLAEHAGDAMLAGRVLAAMSDQTAWLGHPRQSLALAITALDRAGPAATPLVAAMLHDKHAWALARTGDEGGCMAALRELEKAVSRATPGDGPVWASHYNAGDVAECQGHCLRLLGRPAQAERSLVESRALQDPARVRSRAYGEADLALAFLQRPAPDLEGALEAAYHAVTLASGLSSARITAKLRELDNAFAEHRTLATQRWRRAAAPLLAGGRHRQAAKPVPAGADLSSTAPK